MSNSYDQFNQHNQSMQTPSPSPLITDLSLVISDMTSKVSDQAVIIERQRQQIARQDAREQAYKCIFENAGRTFTPGPYGRSDELISDVIKHAYVFVSDTPLARPPFIQIEFERQGYVELSYADYFSHPRLIHIIRQCGVRVYILKTEKNTADLLRQIIDAITETKFLPFYGGWVHNEVKCRSRYLVFPDFSTCNPLCSLEAPHSLAIDSQAITATAVKQFLPVFEIITNPFLREILLLLYHVALLYTLLPIHGYKFPLSFSLFSSDENILSFLRKLLSWFKSPPLTLDLPNNDFSRALLSRKDQPLLIEDGGRLDHSKSNATVLKSAILNGTTPWKNGRDTHSLPLQALIVLLSSYPSIFNCIPEVIVLDIAPNDFDLGKWCICYKKIDHSKDYMTAFCSFTSDHLNELQEALKRGLDSALGSRLFNNGDKLTDKSLQCLGVLGGIKSFLKLFFSYASVESVPFHPNDIEFSDMLQNLFIQASEKADRVSLTDEFIEVSKRMIQTDVLHVHLRDRCPRGETNIIFYDANYLYFTSEAFFKVCQSMLQSRPVILKALTEAGLIGGARTNQTTAQTRITVWDVNKKSRLMSVYAIPRESFESFGDPLFIEEEDTHDEP